MFIFECFLKKSCYKNTNLLIKQKKEFSSETNSENEEANNKAKKFNKRSI